MIQVGQKSRSISKACKCMLEHVKGCLLPVWLGSCMLGSVKGHIGGRFLNARAVCICMLGRIGGHLRRCYSSLFIPTS